MFKKTVLLSGLILFLIPNISYASHGDECGDCMSQVALGACICVTVFCLSAADHNQQLQKFKLRAVHPNSDPASSKKTSASTKENKMD